MGGVPQGGWPGGRAPTASEPTVVRKRGTMIWLVPAMALLIGGWLAVSSYLERGTEIVILFDRAEGIESEKTVIRHKNVVIGKVESVALTDDFERVEVTARIDRGLERHLRADSEFWIVRPRVSAGSISGLSTIVSGSYIAFEPGSAAKRATRFEGLEIPPETPGDAPGLHLTLKAASLGSLARGTPVLHRDIEVGRVDKTRLEGNHVEIDVYIEKEYAGLVRAQTRFWTVSGVSVSLGARGVQVTTGSLESIIRGGISFETPPGVAGGPPVENGHAFSLYKSYDDIGEEYVDDAYNFILYFEDSVRGLTKGAPVEFRGIKVGVVTDVALEYDVSRMWLQIPVKIRLEPGRMRQLGEDHLTFYETIDIMVKRGLRARTKTGSLLTGALYVSLDFDGDAPLELRGRPDDELPEIPTVKGSTAALMADAQDLLAKLKDVPLEELANRAIKTMDSIDQVTRTLQTELTPIMSDLRKTSAAASRAMGRVETSVAESKSVAHKLEKALDELTAAARAIRNLADTLEREPESLLRGKD